MYHLYHHQLQIALFNGLFPLLFRVHALSLSCSHTHDGASGVHCFTACFFLLWPSSSLRHTLLYATGITPKNWIKKNIFFLLRYIRRERNTELCLFDCCDAFCLSFLFAAALRLEERMLCDEKTPEYRRTEPYQRKCATIFHDKRRTNEWNIKLKKILSYEFSVVFFFLLSFTASFFPTWGKHSAIEANAELSVSVYVWRRRWLSGVYIS